jgi:hypothetical protein
VLLARAAGAVQPAARALIGRCCPLPCLPPQARDLGRKQAEEAHQAERAQWAAERAGLAAELRALREQLARQRQQQQQEEAPAAAQALVRPSPSPAPQAASPAAASPSPAPGRPSPGAPPAAARPDSALDLELAASKAGGSATPAACAPQQAAREVSADAIRELLQAAPGGVVGAKLLQHFGGGGAAAALQAALQALVDEADVYYKVDGRSGALDVRHPGIVFCWM